MFVDVESKVEAEEANCERRRRRSIFVAVQVWCVNQIVPERRGVGVRFFRCWVVFSFYQVFSFNFYPPHPSVSTALFGCPPFIWHLMCFLSHPQPLFFLFLFSVKLFSTLYFPFHFAIVTLFLLLFSILYQNKSLLKMLIVFVV